LLTAQAQVDSAKAQVQIAREQQSYTVLYADAPGAVTATGAEPGEVVRAGQMIVQLARQGGRDAVFDVPGRRRPASRCRRARSPRQADVRPCGWSIRRTTPCRFATCRSFGTIRPTS